MVERDWQGLYEQAKATIANLRSQLGHHGEHHKRETDLHDELEAVQRERDVWREKAWKHAEEVTEAERRLGEALAALRDLGRAWQEQHAATKQHPSKWADTCAPCQAIASTGAVLASQTEESSG